MTRPPYRIGFGYDVHQLTDKRPLILGGVHIPSDKGLVGHSDADYLSHAIADAILGCLALPDIGHYFPPTDPKWKDMDSRDILKKACEEVSAHGYQLINIDSTLIAEEPKLAPHRAKMRSTLASTLGIPENCVGIKATTHEKMGALGRREGIAAHAVALIMRTDD